VRKDDGGSGQGCEEANGEREKELARFEVERKRDEE